MHVWQIAPALHYIFVWKSQTIPATAKHLLLAVFAHPSPHPGAVLCEILQSRHKELPVSGSECPEFPRHYPKLHCFWPKVRRFHSTAQPTPENNLKVFSLKLNSEYFFCTVLKFGKNLPAALWERTVLTNSSRALSISVYISTALCVNFFQQLFFAKNGFLILEIICEILVLICICDYKRIYF